MAKQVGSATFRVGLRDAVSGASRRMGRAVDALARGLRKLDSAQQKTGKGPGRDTLGRFTGDGRKASAIAKKLGFELGNVSGRMRTVAMVAGGFAGVVGGLLAYKLTNLVDLAGKTQLAFKNMFGNEKLGEERLKKTLDMAERYGLGIETAIDKTRMFKGLGFNDSQIDAMIGMGADMKALGLSAESVNRVYLQLGQIGAKGKLQGEELIVLAENGISISKVYDRLGKRLGKTREEIIKMQAAGDIKSGPALNAIGEAIVIGLGKTKLGEAGAEAADQTISGLIGRMGTRLERGMFEAAKEAEPALFRGLNAIFEGQKLADGTMGKSAIVSVFETIGNVLERIGPKLPEIADNFTKAFGAAAGFDATSIDKFADGLPQMATRLGEIAGSLLSIASTFAKLEGVLKFFNLGGSLGKGGQDSATSKAYVRPDSTDPMLEGLDMGKIANAPMHGVVPGYWDGVWQRVRKSLGGVDEEQWGRTFGQRIAFGLANGINANSHIAEQAATNMARAVDSATRSELDVHSPSQKMANIGGETGAGLAVGMLDSTDMVISSARSLSRDVINSSADELRSMSGNYGAMTAGAAESLTSSNSGGNSVSIGDIHIHVDGSGDPKAVTDRLYETLDMQLADLINRRLEGIGA